MCNIALGPRFEGLWERLIELAKDNNILFTTLSLYHKGDCTKAEAVAMAALTLAEAHDRVVKSLMRLRQIAGLPLDINHKGG